MKKNRKRIEEGIKKKLEGPYSIGTVGGQFK